MIPGLQTLSERFLRWTQRNLLILLVATYVLGLFLPAAGIALRSIDVFTIPGMGDSGVVSLPMLMLGALLVVAGLGARFEDLKGVAKQPSLVLVGLATNALYPVAFTTIGAVLLLGWHDTDEAQNVLVGLAMIGAMPVAGASTAWSQNSDGNLALSLGLVWLSTISGPLITPLGLHAVGLLTRGDYSEDLHELARGGSTAFVVLVALVPSLIGLSAKAALPKQPLDRVMPALRVANLANLLLLNYSNASVALPQIAREPDWDFLALVLVIVGLMCGGGFLVGWLMPKAFRAPRPDRVAMTFGIGMNNNGTGLALASSALADHALVFIPIILYNLVQQIVAGVVDRRVRR